jgi:hypothetical protein
VHGLTRDAQGVADLLPGPPPLACCLYVRGLDAFGESSQRLGRSQPKCGIVGNSVAQGFIIIHGVSLD